MNIGNTTIQDTFAEAWDLEVVRLVLTAISADVALGSAHQFVGAAGSSELGSRINGGIERPAHPQETPDGRPGVFVSLTLPPDRREALIEELSLRLVLATLVPTCAVFDAMIPEAVTETIDLHGPIAGTWKGHETTRSIDGRSICVVPTTTGEFAYEKTIALSTSGTDGHIVCYAESQATAVLAVKAARDAIAAVDGVAPMGYGLEQIFRELDYVPALRDQVADSKVPANVASILNLLMFGATPNVMREGIRVAIQAAARVDGLREIGAMNFGGEFGRHEYHLHRLFAA